MAPKVAGLAGSMAMRFGRRALGAGHSADDYMVAGTTKLNRHAENVFHAGQSVFNSTAAEMWSGKANRGLFANNTVAASAALNPWQATRQPPQMQNFGRNNGFFSHHTDKQQQKQPVQAPQPPPLHNNPWGILGGTQYGPRGGHTTGSAPGPLSMQPTPQVGPVDPDYVPPSVQSAQMDELFEGFAEDGRNRPIFRPTPGKGYGAPYGPARQMNPNYDPDA